MDGGPECGWGVEEAEPLDGWRDSVRGGKLADEGEPSGRGDGKDPPWAETGVRTGLRSGGGAASSRAGRCRSPGRGAGAEKPTSTRGVPLGLIMFAACGLVGPAGALSGVPAPEPGWR